MYAEQSMRVARAVHSAERDEDRRTDCAAPRSDRAQRGTELRSPFWRHTRALLIAAAIGVGGAAALVTALGSGRPLAVRPAPVAVQILPPTPEQLAVQAHDSARDEPIARAILRVEHRLIVCTQWYPYSGDGEVTLTIEPDGRPSRVEIGPAALAGTLTARCMELAFRDIAVPPFEGAPLTVRRSFHMP